ncbi:ring finger protein [Galdieria sulphuraria]|uniref:Ring finger protein n=1 Tax=Galdieria sulphuraria TaxID=130081 RepID=M2XJU9_GALSU|nr:ring finger protein [Galdieria sulphuraria]EME30387.1 ring finger protein [Galdieria sulphuraria]|eukprot:XP_005706907.1 ring finger protein [Galdieria sulphuraria]
MILTGVGCSINNHIRRRRGLRGFLDPSATTRTRRRRTLSRAARRKEKGLSAYEVEIYCPEIIYKGPLETPLLFWEEDEEVLTPTQVEEKTLLEPPSPIATKEELSLEDKGNDHDDSYKATSWFADSDRNSDTETTQVRAKRLKFYFLGQHILPDGVCAVCLEVVEKDSHLRLLPCGHAFHVHCITHWLSYGTRCPLCNETVRLSDHGRNSSSSTQQLHSVRVISGNNNSSPQTLPLFMAVGHTVNTPQPNREHNIQSIQDPETISKEVVMQSFERIRLRLYERYLERQQKAQPALKESLDAIVVDGEASRMRSSP